MIELNKGNIKKIIGIITFTVLLYVGLSNVESILKILQILLGLFAPFLIGGCIAFILNVPMRYIEKKCFQKSKFSSGFKRICSLILTLVFIVIVIFIVFFLIIPELTKTIQGLFISVPGAVKNFQEWLLSLDIQWPQVQEMIAKWDMNWNTVIQKTLNFLQNGLMGGIFTTVGVVSSIVNGIVRFFIGFVFAIYILCQKENLARQTKKLNYAILPEKMADHVVYIVRLTERTFSNFLTGQCLEAIILGSMFFIAMTLLKFPYAMLVGVLISITALIPIMGAFIGCTIAIFLIVTVNPIQAIWFIVLFNVLQQFEGNVIYPRVVGNSVGLPAMWVLMAVTIGGSMMGVVGMLIYIPMFSVIYALLREYVGDRLKKAKIPETKWKN